MHKTLEPPTSLNDMVPALNLVEAVQASASSHTQKVAYTFLEEGDTPETHLSFYDLDQRARAIGAKLQSLALERKRAILLYPSGLDFITTFFGCLYAGIIAVPVYPPRLNRPMTRLQKIAEDADAGIALTTTKYLSSLQKRAIHSSQLESIQWLATDQISGEWASEWVEPEISGESLAFLQYTSGSTGSPKGVKVSHNNILYNHYTGQIRTAQSQNPILVSWLPLYHDMGLIGNIIQPVFSGSHCIFMSPTDFLQKPVRWLNAISQYRATFSGGPNFSYDLCVEKITPEQRASLDLSSWEVAYVAAEPVRKGTLERFYEAFEPSGFKWEAFYPGYGLAEATLFVSGGSVKAPPVIFQGQAKGYKRSPGSNNNGAMTLVGCGKTLEGQKIVIADPETLAECVPGHVGEIWVTGPGVAQGYWNNPEETQAIFEAHLSGNGEGPYLRTGDLGFLKDEELFITGRLKDLVIIRGHNHYPQDIEATVEESHPALSPNGGAAFSIEVDDAERLVIVHEVKRRYRKSNLSEAISAIRQAVTSNHEIDVQAIVLIKPQSLPRTSSGKVMRYACRDAFIQETFITLAVWSAFSAPISSNLMDNKAEDGKKKTQAVTPKSSNKGPDSVAIESWIIAQISQRANIPLNTIDPSHPLDRYGIDSLEVVNMTLEFEDWTGVAFPIKELWDYPSITALADRVSLETKFIEDLPTSTETSPESDDLANVAADYEVVDDIIIRMKTTKDGKSLKERPTQKKKQPLFSFEKQRLGMLNERYYDAIAKDKYFYHQVITSQNGAWVEINGKKMLMLASYGYLDLLRHPKVDQAAQAALEEFGTGTHGVRLLAGTTKLHKELEETIARFKDTDDAMVFSSGYITNMATIAALADNGHVVICDKLDHASIMDGCSLSRAKLMIFRHNDMDDLERCLQQSEEAGKLVVVDAVFSMDGDIINLPRVVDLCKNYGATLMVDEAHSLGVIGKTGHGIEEHFGMGSDAIQVKMGTLSKTIPSIGGYIAGSRELISALRHNARSYIFSAALPPPQVAAAKAAFEVIEEEPERVTALQRKVKRYIKGLGALGFDTLQTQTSIVPIVCHTEDLTFEMTRFCQAEGVFVLPILFPAVPIKSPRLRTTITMAHSDEDIDFALEILGRAGRKCGIIG